MKKYKGCFIGIPLPKKFIKEHRELQRKIKDRCPSVSLAYRDIPHITLCYLNEQLEKEISEIAEIILEGEKWLRDCAIIVGGFGYFNKDFPKVLYLDADAPRSFYKFQKNLAKKLEKYHEPNDRGYNPHLTLARIKNMKAGKGFLHNESKLENLLNSVFWKFTATEVVIFGKDIEKQEGIHKKLRVISLR